MKNRANMIMHLVYATIISIFVGSLAFATPYNPPGPNANMVYELTIGGSAFSSQAINTAKTFDPINVGGYHTVLVEIDYTYSAATAVTMTCDESPDNSTWFTIPQSDESNPPTVSFAERVWSWATESASAKFYFEVPVRYRYLKCAILGTGADGSDVADASATVAE